MAPPRKVSIRQTEILADFAEAHQHIALRRFCSVQGLKEARRAWESVAVRLNAVGIKKTPEQWRRYWIEYKAKLRSKAADSRRGTLTGPGGRLRPLSDQEQQLLELINHVAPEGLPDSHVSDVQYSLPQASRPESQPNSLEVEWLDCDSEFDEQLDKESDGSTSVEPPGYSEPVDISQSAAETEDEVPGHIRERRKKLGTSRNFLKQTFNKSDKQSKSRRLGELYKDKQKELIDSRLSAKPLQHNAINTSSLLLTTGEAQDPDLLFFHSILPEMKQMTPEQKRQFKMGVWSLASQILEPNTIDSPSDHNYGLIQKRYKQI